jgi:hypothetical protein
MYLILQRLESTENTTTRLEGVDPSVLAIVLLQLFGCFNSMLMLANDRGHPFFCVISVIGSLVGLSVSNSMMMVGVPKDTHPSTTIDVPRPPKVIESPTVKFPLI